MSPSVSASYDEPGHLDELTFSCYRRMPLLTNDAWREMLAQSVDRAVARHAFRLAAFVFMPQHVHLVVYSIDAPARLDGLLEAIKRPFSFRIKRRLADARSPLLEKLTTGQRPGVTTFRFWQEGPGYDRNLTEVGTALASIDYIHMNPAGRGLVKRAIDWRWSSARWYADPPLPSDAGLPAIHGLPDEWLDDG